MLAIVPARPIQDQETPLEVPSTMLGIFADYVPYRRWWETGPIHFEKQFIKRLKRCTAAMVTLLVAALEIDKKRRFSRPTEFDSVERSYVMTPEFELQTADFERGGSLWTKEDLLGGV